VSCAVEALGSELEPPYRAVAQRRAGETWAVGAVAIEIAELPADLEGDELVLTVAESGERELLVDGIPSEAATGALEAIAGGASEPYVLRAMRLEGPIWEVAVDPL
jgi:hypothetical protein